MPGTRYRGAVSLVRAVVCPHPPMIVPEIAAGAESELARLRTVADEAVCQLLTCGASRLVVVGSGLPGTGTVVFTGPVRGSLRPWGVPVDVELAAALDHVPPGPPPGPPSPSESPGPSWAPPPVLPLSLIVGAWLLRRGGAASTALSVEMLAVPVDLPVADCLAYGSRLDGPEPLALLVMGDGSACRGPAAPGYDDRRAQPYDDRVAGALADADPQPLVDLDPDLAAELRVSGRAPWQVLAGAVRASGGTWHGTLSWYAAPYGVAYFVATWRPAG